jgi:tetratricopeptide (TPR) repeat protein
LVPTAFAVTSNVVFPIGTVFAERLAYLPLVGVCGIAGLSIRWLTTRRAALGVGLLALLLAAAAGRTFDRTMDFRERVVFDEAAVRASPRAVKALANLGRTRLRQGRVEEGIELLERAVTIWPDYSGALVSLAEAHARQGDAAAALHYRRRAREAFARWQSGEASPVRDD